MRWLQPIWIVTLSALVGAADSHAQASVEPKSNDFRQLTLDRTLRVSVDPSRSDDATVDGMLRLRELVVEPGDNATRLLLRARVLPNAAALHLTQQANPSIADISQLQPGERLKIPSTENYQISASSDGGLVRFVDPGRDKVVADLSRRLQVLAGEADRQDVERLAVDLDANAYRLSMDELDAFAAQSLQAISDIRARGDLSRVDDLSAAMNTSLRSTSARWQVRVRTIAQGKPRCGVRVWYSLAKPGSRQEQFRTLSTPIATASILRGNYKLADSPEGLMLPNAFVLSVLNTDNPAGIDVDLEVDAKAQECSS